MLTDDSPLSYALCSECVSSFLNVVLRHNQKKVLNTQIYPRQYIEKYLIYAIIYNYISLFYNEILLARESHFF